MRTGADIASNIGFHQLVDRYVAMPGSAGTEYRLAAVKQLAALGNAFWVALVAPQFSCFAEILIAHPFAISFSRGQMTELDQRAR